MSPEEKLLYEEVLGIKSATQCVRFVLSKWDEVDHNSPIFPALSSIIQSMAATAEECAYGRLLDERDSQP